jgi:hypothetical protein
MSKVFISGSIAIKKIPVAVEESLQKIMHNHFEILVGDAKGIDTLVQNYCLQHNYHNVTVYSITEKPRYKADSFYSRCINVPSHLKNGRERQQEKDKAMTLDSDYSFVIWDGKSQGSYENALRAIEQHKKIKVYLESENRFLQPKTLKNEIEHIFLSHKNSKPKKVKLIQLDEDIAKVFPTSESVNKALRYFLSAFPNQEAIGHL